MANGLFVCLLSVPHWYHLHYMICSLDHKLRDAIKTTDLYEISHSLLIYIHDYCTRMPIPDWLIVTIPRSGDDGSYVGKKLAQIWESCWDYPGICGIPAACEAPSHKSKIRPTHKSPALEWSTTATWNNMKWYIIKRLLPKIQNHPSILYSIQKQKLQNKNKNTISKGST